jgi:fructose-1-phosphate kinase PfkB-like protein
MVVPIAAATRQTYTVVDDEDGDVVEVIEPSPRLTSDEVVSLRNAVVAQCASAEVVVCAGSWPEGLDLSFGAWLIETARAAGARSVIDTSGAALAAVLAAGPDLVAPNRREAAEVTGMPPSSAAPVLAAALCRQGAHAALVTDGARGAVLGVRDGTRVGGWRYRVPPRPVVNAVGCGDAVVGGVAAGLQRGLDLREAVELGLAAAADKLGRLEGGRVEAAGVAAARRDVTAERLGEIGAA